MFTIKNQNLQVLLLDPVLDRQRLGSRYCTGGYIWQITDLLSGDLLSGPLFPDSNPTQFDGQGAPEVFETALGQNTASINEEVLVIGVGKVVRSSPVHPFHVRDNPIVSEFCAWDIVHNESSISMHTVQHYKSTSLKLTRTVFLKDKTVTSKSSITNIGKDLIPLCWFAHPFFPLNRDLICCKFSRPVVVPDNPGFFINENGYLAMQRNYLWNKGLYCPLQLVGAGNLLIKQSHPLLSEFEIELLFPVSRMPVWANANTFSFEPYLDTTLAPGFQKEWDIEFRF